MKHWSILLGLSLFLFAAAHAEAADLRVDAGSGDDTATYAEVAAGTASWATIGRAAWGSTDRNNPNAAEAAQQGDTVTVAAGIYSAANMSGTRYEPAFNPVNGADSASEADRITFVADGLVELRGQVDDGGPIIGTSGRNYITWQGFYIDEQYVDSRPDTGPVVVWGSDYGEIIDCTIIGDPDPLLHYNGAWDNHNGIRIEAANYAVIRGNYISGFNHMGNGDEGRNAAGIMMYDSRHILIENNELTDNCTGAYIKGSAQNSQTQEDVTVRFNLVHNNTQRGLQLMGIEGERSRVYQNVVHGNPTGVLIQHQNDTSIPHNLDFVNNTLANNSTGIMYRIDGMPQSNRYHNNIVTHGDVGFMSEGTDFTHLDSQHHCLFGHANATDIAYQSHTLAEWITETGQEQAPPATIEQDPLYEDAASDDYRLQDTSPCGDIGVDVLDLDGDGATDDIIPAGAYVNGDEVIGPAGGGGPNGGSGGAGGAGGTGTGGGAAGGTGGTGASSAAAPGAEETSGCGCKLASRSSSASGWWLALAIGLALTRRRSERRYGPRSRR